MSDIKFLESPFIVLARYRLGRGAWWAFYMLEVASFEEGRGGCSTFRVGRSVP